MDNNYNTNNYGSDRDRNQATNGYNQAGSSYGQTGSGYSQTGSSYSQTGSGYSQDAGSYSQAGSAYNQTGSGYNRTANAYNPYQQAYAAPPKKKKNGFGMKLVKCAAIALVFGLVAGGVFTGVSYAGTRALGITGPQEAGADAADSRESVKGKTKVQQTATGEAKDLSDVSAIVDEVMPSIVAITNTGTITYQTFWGAQEYQSESCGSGIIVRQDDAYLYIVTNNHVVENSDTLTVQFFDETTVSCEIKGSDQADDLAVVKVDLDSIEPDTLGNIKVATIGDSEALKVGHPAIAIGNALGYGQSLSCGHISALGRTVTIQDETTGQVIVNNNMIQTDAAINPGNSGGALLNASGEVIGINASKYSDTDVEGVGYAIPMSDAMPIVEQLITREKVDPSQSAYLGIRGQDFSADVAEAYNMPEGIYIYQVIPGSPAENAGIHQGDIITAFDGQSVSTMNSLAELLTYYKAGQEVTVTVQRLGGEDGGYMEQKITVTLGSQNGGGKQR
ncbi:MAG: trypsin-like peptidase domain-containing protein [Blautia sp.]|nr:trypsin-like peptidase domain-containing protein [Blautia sp.]